MTHKMLTWHALIVVLLSLFPKAVLMLQPLPIEQVLPHSPDFGVSILNGTIQPSPFVYLGTVPGPTGRGWLNASFVKLTLPSTDASISATLNVQVTVLTNNTGINSAALRPRGSPPVTATGPNTVSFEITQAGHYLLELNGEWNVQTLSTGLMLFVSREDRSPVSPLDPSVVYFDAGVHTLANSGVLRLQDDSTVYLAPGAVVQGRIQATNVHNVTISGTGILASEWLPGYGVPSSVLQCHHCGCPGNPALLVQNSSSVTISGSLTVLHATGWMVKLDRVTNGRVQGLQLFGWRCNNDGIDLVSSRNILVEQCFIRSADDAIAIKGNAPKNDTTDIVVQDSLLFPHGNCLEIGFELANNHIRNITFQRMVCFHQMMNAMSVHNGGHAIVDQILYHDIIIEGVVGPVSKDESYGYKLLDLQIAPGKYSGPDIARRGSITNIVYSNVIYYSNGLQWMRSRMVGNSSEHAIEGVRCNDFTIDGKTVMSLQDLHTIYNAFVRNITFQSSINYASQPF